MEKFNRYLKRIVLPTPYYIGWVAVYLITDDPITLIDTGVCNDESYGILVDALAFEGLSVGDIKRIVITHGHCDHFGMTHRITRESGAQVFIHRADYEKAIDRRNYYMRFISLMERLGTPQVFAPLFVNFLDWESRFCVNLPCNVTFLEDGDELLFENFSLTVVHTPGHSMGHIVLVNDSLAITGDLIFTDLTSEPILDTDENGNRIKSMLFHLDSLKKVKEMGVVTFFPSHKEEVGDFDEAVKRLYTRLDAKGEVIINWLRTVGRATPYQICELLYENLDKSFLYVVMSEVMGRLDYLEARGLVKSEIEDGKIYYRVG